MKTAFSKPDGGKGKMAAVIFGILLVLISPMTMGCRPEVQAVVMSGLQSGLTSLSTAFINAFFLGIQLDSAQGTATGGT